MKIKVGFGFDVHQLKDGLDFWLGGIKVPHTKGGLGHSDAEAFDKNLIAKATSKNPKTTFTEFNQPPD